MTVECPTCGERFDGKKGMRYHHARVHGESIAGDLITCDNCGTEKRRNPAKINENGPVYCSTECQNEDRRTNIPKETLYRLYWGENMSVEEVANELGVSTTPVKRCMKEYGIPLVDKFNEIWVFDQRGRGWLKSEYMDKKKSTYTIAQENDIDHEYVRRRLHSLGIPLRNSWIKNIQQKDTGERSEIGYGREWTELATAIRERDNHTCQGCGRKQSDLDHTLHVHHITPIRTFKNVEEANKPENLVSLCYACHNRWENIPVKPTVLS